MGKIQIPSVGGIRKVVKTGDQSTPGTTIAELGAGTITLAQLAFLITQLQAAQANTGGGNIGAGDEATISLGPGLAGGGVLVGNVPIRITAPIPWFDDGGGADGDPGPPGQAGVAGAAGSPGAQGAAGVATFLEANDGEDGWHAIPGNQGPQGIQGVTGSQGPQGIQGSGSGGTSGLMMWVPDDIVTDEEVYRGPASACGALTINGPLSVNGTESIAGNIVFNAVTSRSITFLGATPLIQATTAAAVLSIIANATGGINMGTGAINSLTLNSSGTCTLSGASGAAQQLLINATGNIAAIIANAGSTNLNSNMIWRTAATTVQLMRLFGDGGLVVGPSTMVDMTTGTVNVSGGYYVNSVLVAGGNNATPIGVMHGMVPEDPPYIDEPISFINVPANAALNSLVINAGTGTRGLIVNGNGQASSITATVAAANYAVNAAGFAGTTVFTGNTAMGIVVGGATSTNDYSGIDFIGGTITTTAHARIALLSTGSGSTLIFGTSNNYGTGITNTALTIGHAGQAIFTSQISAQGNIGAATAGQTDIGITTTGTVITTAGGIALPALAATFWRVNVNGVAYGIPLFAL